MDMTDKNVSIMNIGSMGYLPQVTNVNFTESLCRLFAQRILDDPAFKLFFKLF